MWSTTASPGDRPTSAECDARAGTWTDTAKPSEARFGYTATQLLDGHVLVTGDYEYGSKASPEVYDPGTGS